MHVLVDGAPSRLEDLKITMAHLLILFTILVSTYVDSTVPAVAKSRVS